MIQIRAQNVAADVGLYVHDNSEKLWKGYHEKKAHLKSDQTCKKIIMTLIDEAEGMYALTFTRRTALAC